MSDQLQTSGGGVNGPANAGVQSPPAVASVQPAASTVPPAKPTVTPRRGWVLLAFALFWLVIALHRASLGPSAGIIPTMALWIVGLLTVALWCVGAALALVSRGRFGPLAWFGVPLVLMIGTFVPWQTILFPMRVRAHAAELQALAEKHAWATAGEVRPVNETIGGMKIESVMRVKDSELLVLSSSSRRIRGIGYTPSGNIPEPPSGDGWTRTLGEKWFRFDWVVATTR